MNITSAMKADKFQQTVILGLAQNVAMKKLTTNVKLWFNRFINPKSTITGETP
jgi:hypothetical protein